MIIGGFANAVWGEPRATLDIAATVWVEEGQIDPVVADLASAFRAVTPEPVSFVRETRVLPLESADGVRIDLIFGLLPFERDAIRRAVPIPVAGASARFCTAEDLILMKIISTRGTDLADAEGIVRRRLGVLDLDYLEPRIRELADLLGQTEIIQRWDEWKTGAAGASQQ
jgi:hypothetical protein